MSKLWIVRMLCLTHSEALHQMYTAAFNWHCTVPVQHITAKKWRVAADYTLRSLLVCSSSAMPTRADLAVLPAQPNESSQICHAVVAMKHGMQLTAGLCGGDQLCNAKISEQNAARYGLNDNTLGVCVTPKPAGSSCKTNIGESFYP